jgi:transposase
MRDLFWQSDDAWAALDPHLPHNQPGKPRVDDRRVNTSSMCCHPARAADKPRHGSTVNSGQSPETPLRV